MIKEIIIVRGYTATTRPPQTTPTTPQGALTRRMNKVGAFTPMTEVRYSRYMAHWIIMGRGFALILISLGGFVIVMNWWTIIATHRTGRFHSAVPLVGAGFLAAGLALLPWIRHFAWVAILVDYGTLMLLISLPRLVREEWKTNRRNLVAKYRGGRGIMTACLSLYRDGICVIKYDLKRAPGELGIVTMSSVGTWDLNAQCLTLQFGGTSSEFEVMSGGACEFLRQVNRFSSEVNGELSLVDVELQRQG